MKPIQEGVRIDSFHKKLYLRKNVLEKYKIGKAINLYYNPVTEEIGIGIYNKNNIFCKNNKVTLYKRRGKKKHYSKYIKQFDEFCNYFKINMEKWHGSYHVVYINDMNILKFSKKTKMDESKISLKKGVKG